MKFSKVISLSALLLLSSMSVQAKDYVVTSPDGHLKAVVNDDVKVSWTIMRDEQVVLAPSAIRIQTTTGSWGEKTRVQKARQRSISETIPTVTYKRAEVKNECNELSLDCSGEFNLIVRAYNDGCAYRLVSKSNKTLRVIKESPEFAFTADYQAFVPYINDNRGGERYCYSFESYYDEQKLSAMYNDSIAITPLAVCLPDGMKAVVMETSVEDYPGMFLYRNESSPANTLQTDFAPLPTETVIGGFDRLNLVPVKRADYIADLQKKQSLPWRLVLVTTADTQLLDTDTPYCLAPACRLTDTSWIKPGKVAWDWWNNWNIWGVDFKAGINNETYKYYIDFAAKSGIEYVILDEGWAVNLQADLFQVVSEINLPELVQYATSKGVGIVLWAGYAAMDKDMEHVCQHYADMGVKGFKVDFMDRDDQVVVEFYERMAATAAKYHLFVDFHGAYKPTGMNRTYPNVLNYEGVFGLEQCKWMGSDVDMPTYDVTIPFIRMLAGPLDYTQGAMRNASKGSYVPMWSEPMSMGTRCHQLAEYIIFDSPFSMLCDAPTAYLQEPECTEFIAAVPTVWDETKMLDGKVGEYVVTAKRKGDKWYVGVLTNWTARTLTIDLQELGIQSTTATAYLDGPNAYRKGCDYQKKTVNVSADGKLSVEVAPGGGAVFIF